MPIEVSIKQGDIAAENKDFLTAVSKYTEALGQNSQAYAPLIKRAQAYTKLCDYDSAKADISKAFTVLERRGNMADKATCYFRLGVVNYLEKQYVQAHTNFQRAKTFKSTEPALDIWIEKARRDCVKNGLPISEAGDSEPVQETGASNAPSLGSMHTLNKQAPIKAKIRDEWYQSKQHVTITIYAANLATDSVSVSFGARCVSVSFPTSQNSEYNYSLDQLAGEIVPAECSYAVTAKKVEITLVKAEPAKWSALEASAAPAVSNPAASAAPSYPSSSRKKVDWAHFAADEDEPNADPEDFFAKLYKDVDEDTRRAMMKSYVESNGTVLTTNWSEAKDKKFDTRPPDGMEAKKW